MTGQVNGILINQNEDQTKQNPEILYTLED